MFEVEKRIQKKLDKHMRDIDEKLETLLTVAKDKVAQATSKSSKRNSGEQQLDLSTSGKAGKDGAGGGDRMSTRENHARLSRTSEDFAGLDFGETDKGQTRRGVQKTGIRESHSRNVRSADDVSPRKQANASGHENSLTRLSTMREEEQQHSRAPSASSAVSTQSGQKERRSRFGFRASSSK
mmetsp:Transcript_14150/g.24628  ORF Transcript_14150/g.24628 Transcript_14150/m.24628 type:complete len:182 (+) Transcript_14150:233-778(+)|eukprot:CAMPEP_0205903686 /NCGR_PEP_ID=MMETSP1325-20131115/253_1 /ASSEMBLY_ACC=CAM_ASM_000708 /TAXON_ID=236786 /ORGANISM="Florenciella sp., Strain RCC1007" /LENGTH=181 /DNA_ID=CAMNT_0053269361 /DNA_START=229 /DNA_END=774 /DNA_ORIENTATION=+